ncbi:MAG TPA: energy transducer TonB [Candidatus Binataceae bacterium]|nr:energy transducer TonB [Candidatus Binataceae bacterium]
MRAQDAAPVARPAVELESEPPDEPSSEASPEVEMAPGAASSPSSTGSNEELPWADQVAHAPEILTYVVPEYPAKAREEGIEGRVLLTVVIDESGRVEDDVQVADSIPQLDRAAIAAVHRWSFTPARDEHGNPVRVQMEVPVPFVLK